MIDKYLFIIYLYTIENIMVVNFSLFTLLRVYSFGTFFAELKASKPSASKAGRFRRFRRDFRFSKGVPSVFSRQQLNSETSRLRRRSFPFWQKKEPTDFGR